MTELAELAFLSALWLVETAAVTILSALIGIVLSFVMPGWWAVGLAAIYWAGIVGVHGFMLLGAWSEWWIEG